MDRYRLLAPAKINLHLEILGLRSDGFHELAMVMQSIALADLVEVRNLPGQEIVLQCDRSEVPSDRTNLAYRAAELMAQRFPTAARGVDISLHKRIPMAAGLAGGSGNAAAVLMGLNLLWDLGATQADLQEIGAILGSDVPFCLSGGTALATGRGEVIDNLPSLRRGAVVLGKYRSIAVSTPWAYGSYRAQFGHGYPASLATGGSHAQPLVKAIGSQDLRSIGQHLYNDLEKVVLPAYPQVAQLREVFARTENLGVLMSGSGPTMFAWAENLEQAEAIATQVRQEIPDADLELLTAAVIDRGIHLEPAVA